MDVLGGSQAEDPDLGMNGEIRYQILGREDAPRFAIDPLSGQVRSVTSFGRDAGRVFGFDVKATDRQGAENGRSSIVNVFVSLSSFSIPPPHAVYLNYSSLEITLGLISPRGNGMFQKTETLYLSLALPRLFHSAATLTVYSSYPEYISLSNS